MALDKQILVNGIKDMQKRIPKNNIEAANRWSLLLFNYCSGAMAADAIPVFAGYPKILADSFLLAMNSMTFFETFGINLQTMWTVAAFTGTLTTGITSVADGAMLTSKLKRASQRILKGSDSINEIASAIHEWSKTIKVSSTNNQSGVIAIVPLITTESE